MKFSSSAFHGSKARSSAQIIVFESLMNDSRLGGNSMAVFRIHFGNGEGRIEADLKAADEVLVCLSAERWFGDTDWRIAENRCIGLRPGLKPTELAGGG